MALSERPLDYITYPSIDGEEVGCGIQGRHAHGCLHLDIVMAGSREPASNQRYISPSSRSIGSHGRLRYRHPTLL